MSTTLTKTINTQDTELTERVEASLRSEFIQQVCFDSNSAWAFEALIEYMRKVREDGSFSNKFIKHVQSAIECTHAVNLRCSKQEKYLTKKYNDMYNEYMFDDPAA